MAPPSFVVSLRAHPACPHRGFKPGGTKTKKKRGFFTGPVTSAFTGDRRPGTRQRRCGGARRPWCCAWARLWRHAPGSMQYCCLRVRRAGLVPERPSPPPSPAVLGLSPRGATACDAAPAAPNTRPAPLPPCSSSFSCPSSLLTLSLLSRVQSPWSPPSLRLLCFHLPRPFRSAQIGPSRGGRGAGVGAGAACGRGDAEARRMGRCGLAAAGGWASWGRCVRAHGERRASADRRRG